jgi:pentatricopeptide repeat protein
MRGYGILPSSITYGILIKSFGQANKLDKAFGMFQEMKSLKLTPNSVTYGCLLDACVKNSDIKRAN